MGGIVSTREGSADVRGKLRFRDGSRGRAELWMSGGGKGCLSWGVSCERLDEAAMAWPKIAAPSLILESARFSKQCVFLIRSPKPLLAEQFLSMTNFGCYGVFCWFFGFPFLFSLKKKKKSQQAQAQTSTPSARPLGPERPYLLSSPFYCVSASIACSLCPPIAMC